MIYVNLKNSAGIIASIARFERAFLATWDLHIVGQREDKITDTIQLAIDTKTHDQDDLVQILVRKYFADKVIGFQLAINNRG
ncbi:MAG: hypothetical protein AB1489_29935 [Acidobacteriota bacterium]